MQYIDFGVLNQLVLLLIVLKHESQEGLLGKIALGLRSFFAVLLNPSSAAEVDALKNQITRWLIRLVKIL